MKKQFFLVILIIAALLRLIVCSFLYSTDENEKLDFGSRKLKFTNKFYYGGDEYESAKSAIYYRNTGFILIDSTMHSFTKPRLRSNLPYLTAFRPKGYIYIHVLLIYIYEKFYQTNVLLGNDLSIYSYLNFYGMFIYFLNLILYCLSLFYFYRLLLLLKIQPIVAQAGTILYVFIPSIFIYIGMLDTFENAALYCQVVFVYFIVKEWVATQKGKLNLLAPFLVLSCLFRPHLLLTYAILIISIIFAFLYHRFNRQLVKKHFYNIKTSIIGFCLLVITIIPIFIQNHHYFGHYLLSTQANFEFFQGHNPFARSSWNPNIYTQNKPFFDSIIKNKQIVYLDEFQESKFYSEIGWNWIKNNPSKVVQLECKKIAAYFIPFNHNNRTINIYTIVLEIAFFLFLFIWAFGFVKSKYVIINKFVSYLILVPVVMTILLTIMFFVGYRWRFYAEPFMLIMLLVLVDGFLFKSKGLKN